MFSRSICFICDEVAGRSQRPVGIIALCIFFSAGALISFTAGVSLLIPGSFLEPMWRLNPRGHEGLVHMGSWAPVLLFAASLSCAAAAAGLWRRARWGHRVAVTLIAINLLSSVANTLLGTEPRAIVGIPIALGLVLYLLSKRVRNYFATSGRSESPH
jgi:hypothetical protein